MLEEDNKTDTTNEVVDNENNSNLNLVINEEEDIIKENNEVSETIDEDEKKTLKDVLLINKGVKSCSIFVQTLGTYEDCSYKIEGSEALDELDKLFNATCTSVETMPSTFGGLKTSYTIIFDDDTVIKFKKRSNYLAVYKNGGGIWDFPECYLLEF